MRLTDPERPGPAPRALSRRRQEIARRWVEGGLLPADFDEAPRWREAQAQEKLAWLRQELERLGPVFSGFGLYLSTRLDFLAGREAWLLATLEDRAAPMPEAEVRERLRAGLGAAEAAGLAGLELEPADSRGLWQTHRASLADGRPVLVKLARTAVLDGEDLALLPHLASHLASVGWPRPAACRMIADFHDFVQRRLDLQDEQEALLAIASTDFALGQVGTARVVPALSGAHVLTIDRPEGTALVPRHGTASELERDEALRARRLADFWLHAVLTVRRVPEELARGDVRLAGEELLLAGGLFRTITREDADDLFDYLVAAAGDDCDGVDRALARLTAPAANARLDALRHHLDHVVPRRDGRFGVEPPGFPELLLAHWPSLEAHGLVPGRALLAFYRGLVCLRELCGPALSRGVLDEALQAAQLTRGADWIGRAAVDPQAPTRWAEGLLSVLTRLPDLVGRRSRPRRREAHRPTSGPDRGTARLAAWLLLAATAALCLRQLQLAGGWAGLAGAFGVAAAGAFLLGWIRRA